MKYLYYQIGIRVYTKKAGLFYRPVNSKSVTIERSGDPMPNIDGLVLELKDGPYVDYMLSTGAAVVVSDQLRELFEKYGALNDGMEFYPVKTESKEYGNRIYNILHYSRVLKGVYRKLSDFIELPPKPIGLMPRDFTPYSSRFALDYSKIEGLSFLTTCRLGVPQVIVSDEVRKAINRDKMNTAIQYIPYECANVPEELIRKGYHSVNAPDPADRGDDLSRFPHLRIKSDLFNN